MDHLSTKDNDALRKQEWRLLSEKGPESESIDIPEDYSQDTFLVKSLFWTGKDNQNQSRNQSNNDSDNDGNGDGDNDNDDEPFYLILLTNMKHLWVEKLGVEEIRKRSKKIKSFDYEDDSQIEALLQSLSAVFSTERIEAEGSTYSKRRIEARDENKLSLFVVFDFGLASVQWEFRLAPMMTPATVAISLTQHQPTLGMTAKVDRFAGRSKRGRLFSESSDDEYDDLVSNTLEIGTQLDHDKDTNEEECVDGHSVLFDHLVLPLISIANAYRRQAKSYEAIIKAKENEVFEALELLEQNGINHRNRRRTTAPFVKAAADAKLQSDLERLRKPQIQVPRDLFSEKQIPTLCAIVTKNAQPHNTQTNTLSATQLDPSSLSQFPTANIPLSIAASSSSGGRRQGASDIGGPDVSDGLDNASKATAKEEKELERRRILEEKLEKEKAILEKSRKKKKLF
ncbi:hypothetical protein BGZ94_006707 [Podila epigama]|nr:hypothetical protein BGZ94_006707 [Podila epigama]